MTENLTIILHFCQQFIYTTQLYTRNQKNQNLRCNHENLLGAKCMLQNINMQFSTPQNNNNSNN